jgi:hypothetical protein
VLFFLRFAPELARRGARLAFRGDPRLHAMLARTGLFALGLAARCATRTVSKLSSSATCRGFSEPKSARFPQPLPLAPLPERSSACARSLEARGPRPWNALTWRGGVASAGPARTQVKEWRPISSGEAVRGRPGDLDRHPAHCRARASSSASPRSARRSATSARPTTISRTCSRCSSLADGYIGVSNANTHLRAGARRRRCRCWCRIRRNGAGASRGRARRGSAA